MDSFRQMIKPCSEENCKVRGLVHFSARRYEIHPRSLPENMDLTPSRCRYREGSSQSTRTVLVFSFRPDGGKNRHGKYADLHPLAFFRYLLKITGTWSAVTSPCT